MKPVEIKEHIIAAQAHISLAERQLTEAKKRCEQAKTGVGPAYKNEIMDLIARVARIADVPPEWALAIAKVESNFGKYQLSPTYARGIFQLTSIAFEDLRIGMESNKDDIIDILVGIAFLKKLLTRHKTVEAATRRYCSPADTAFYVPKVLSLMESYGRTNDPKDGNP